MALCHSAMKYMINENKICGILADLKSGINRKSNTFYVDFILKVKREDAEIYDLCDCSIYGNKARKFIDDVEYGNVIFVSGRYRSSKIMISDETRNNKYSHFLVDKYTILVSEKI